MEKREITVDELRNDNISNEDLKIVRKLNRSIRSNALFLAFGGVLGVGIFSMFLYELITVDKVFLNLNGMFLIIGIVSFGIALVFSLKTFFKTIPLNCCKSQYGVVSNKYKSRKSLENENEKEFVNVYFPEQKSYLMNVECLFSSYKKLQVGSNVLIISFNGKKAYAVHTNDIEI